MLQNCMTYETNFGGAISVDTDGYKTKNTKTNLHLPKLIDIFYLKIELRVILTTAINNIIKSNDIYIYI